MKLRSILFVYVLFLLTSCKGQHTLENPITNEKVAVGDTVSELSKSIWYVFQASNGDYWFGSDGQGVYRFTGKSLLNYNVDHGLLSNRIRGIQEDKQGHIFISTLEGINKFDGRTIVSLNPVPSNYAGDNWKLQPDDLWFSILGKNGSKGPFRYDGKYLYQLEFPKHYMADDYYKQFPNNAWSPYEVYYIYKDRNENMWFGTSNFGLCRYDGKTLSWLYEDHLTNTPGGGSFGIRSILEDKKGKFWFCNTRYRYTISPDVVNEKDRTLIAYEKEKGIEGITSVDGTDYNYFLSAIEDKGGDLWLATYREGIWRYTGTSLIHYPVRDGEKDITVFTIYQDKAGEIWLGTHETGVYKFNGTAFEKFNFRQKE